MNDHTIADGRPRINRNLRINPAPAPNLHFASHHSASPDERSLANLRLLGDYCPRFHQHSCAKTRRSTHNRRRMHTAWIFFGMRLLGTLFVKPARGSRKGQLGNVR